MPGDIRAAATAPTGPVAGPPPDPRCREIATNGCEVGAFGSHQRDDVGDALTPSIGLLDDGEIRTSIRKLLVAGSDGIDPLEVSTRQAARSRFAAEIARRFPGIGLDKAAALAIELADELTGLGPAQRFVDDPTVTEVMVNGPFEIWVERSGRLELTDAQFSSAEALRKVIEKTVGPLGLRIDDTHPVVDARLPDGSRFHAVLPPVARTGPVVTVRKFERRLMSLDDLIETGAVSDEAAEFMAAAVRARANIVVSGGTSSGKTTLLNVFSSVIPAGERIVTVEDAAELSLDQDHVVSLESRPPNIEGIGGVTIRDLVRAALRMRPDRVVVGEVRGAEALDMLQAMNTGHEGSLTTVHANSVADSLLRIEMMVLMADVSLEATALRQQITGAIDLVIQTSRDPSGARRVLEIAEIDERVGWPPLRVLMSRRNPRDRPSGDVRCSDPMSELTWKAEPNRVIERCASRGHNLMWSPAGGPAPLTAVPV